MMTNRPPRKAEAGADPVSRSYRRRLRPSNDWEDDQVKRLILNRWAAEETHRPTGSARLVDSFLRRSSNALETLVKLRKRSEAEANTDSTEL